VFLVPVSGALCKNPIMKFFKDSVSAEMLGHRLSDLYAVMSRSVEKSVEKIERAGVGERVYQAIRYKTELQPTWGVPVRGRDGEGPSAREDCRHCFGMPPLPQMRRTIDGYLNTCRAPGVFTSPQYRLRQTEDGDNKI
jgi:hypothetical protein